MLLEREVSRIRITHDYKAEFARISAFAADLATQIVAQPESVAEAVTILADNIFVLYVENIIPFSSKEVLIAASLLFTVVMELVESTAAALQEVTETKNKTVASQAEIIASQNDTVTTPTATTGSLSAAVASCTTTIESLSARITALSSPAVAGAQQNGSS